MIDIKDIEKTITELENGSTSFANCQKLATLYTVMEHFNSIKSKANDIVETTDEVVKEYQDVLPAYRHYKDTKRKYQLNETTKEAVLQELKYVCNEVIEFISVLYSNSDMLEERELLTEMISKVKGQ